jgi:hypothetical protein
MTAILTERQRAAMEALQAARAAGVGLSAYARANGLNARQVHDAVTQLRRRGVIPPTDRAHRRSGAFVSVKVRSALGQAPDVARSTRGGMVCRLVHADGFVIECGEWPPAAWLLSLASGRRDASS